MDRVIKKQKLTRRKLIVITILIIILIAFLTGIFFLLNKLIPVKNITEETININLSTIKPTGSNITANVLTKTHYDIYYFIDYTFAEEKYYEDETSSEEAMAIKVKQISDKEYRKVENSQVTIENNGVIYLKYGRFGKLSPVPYVFEITNIDKTGPEIGELETSSTYTSITVNVTATDNTSSELEYSFRLADSSQYISTGSKNTYTFTELTTNENYTIYVKVIDQFGNESEAVTEASASVDQNIVEKKVYHFKVNVAANTVTVYDKDEAGKYTQAIIAFVCSTGRSTPKSGTYKISDRYRWRSLIGGVYGQYAVRIHGNILFHSVPYERMYANTLEYWEYDKLGTAASLGCVRLCVKDAKWIYDNAKAGSTVEFYSDSSNPGPLGKPQIQKISDNRQNRNWDPTDPDEHNPWLGGDGTVTRTILVDDDYYMNTTTNTISNTTTNTTNTVSNTITNNTVVWNTND